MPQCAFKNCKNNHRNIQISDGISFFRFPNDPFRFAKWVSIVAKERGEEFYTPCKNSKICSIHFDKLDITGNTQRLRLLKSAIPKLQVPNLQQNNKESQTSSSATDLQNLPIIATVYLYLEKEYEYMKNLNGDNCDLSPLADILKRTAEATGTSEENVITILETEDLSHHLPERAKTKRKKTKRTKIHEESSELNSEQLTEDHDMLQDDNDTNVQDETIGYAVYGHEPKPTGSNDSCGTLDTSRTKVKVELNDDETMSANRLFLEISPLDRTSDAVKSITPGAEGTEVKLEEDDPLRQIYCNRHKGDMEIENYTFIISTPNDLTSTSDATEVTVKLELEPEDDN